VRESRLRRAEFRAAAPANFAVLIRANIMRMNTTLVINSKGGSGKTTVTTSLASYFASRAVPVTVMDYDPQGSSLNWLRLRDGLRNRIHAANAAPQKGNRLRGIEMHVPADTRQLVIDAPAGASGLLLQEMLGRADCILIPVAPSAIDIHATANFIRDLLLAGRIRMRNIRLGVVANKVRNSMPTYEPLERFLKSLGLPLLTRLADSDVYLQAVESGAGLFEMDAALAAAEREQFRPVAEWVEGVQPRTAGLDRKIVQLPARLRLVAGLASA
jgi:chromosome partitioning protein